MINVNNIIKKSRCNGHGSRFTIWVQGCNRRCLNCFNPETQPHTPNRLIEAKTLINEVLSTPGIDGISLSGGEPLLQAGELAELAKAVKTAGLSVIIFTGYAEIPDTPEIKELMRYTDMVIAGEYDQTRPSAIPLIGSDNQRVINLTGRLPEPQDDDIPRCEIISDGKNISLSGFPTEAERQEFMKIF